MREGYCGACHDWTRIEVQNVPRTEDPRCECDECKPCRNVAALDENVMMSPMLCTPCLFGCMP